MESLTKMLLRTTYMTLLQESFTADLINYKSYYRYDAERLSAAVIKLLHFYEYVNDVLIKVDIVDSLIEAENEFPLGIVTVPAIPHISREGLTLSLRFEENYMGESLNKYLQSQRYRFVLKENNIIVRSGSVGTEVEFLLQTKEILSPSYIWLQNESFIQKILNGTITEEIFISSDYFNKKLDEIYTSHIQKQ